MSSVTHISFEKRIDSSHSQLYSVNEWSKRVAASGRIWNGILVDRNTSWISLHVTSPALSQSRSDILVYKFTISAGRPALARERQVIDKSIVLARDRWIYIGEKDVSLLLSAYNGQALRTVQRSSVSVSARNPHVLRFVTDVSVNFFPSSRCF